MGRGGGKEVRARARARAKERESRGRSYDTIGIMISSTSPGRVTRMDRFKTPSSKRANVNTVRHAIISMHVC